ncbi:hypothetical protein PENTCL1PPCAC_25489, partial [Pristionchus entomophagus]
AMQKTLFVLAAVAMCAFAHFGKGFLLNFTSKSHLKMLRPPATRSSRPSRLTRATWRQPRLPSSKSCQPSPIRLSKSSNRFFPVADTSSDTTNPLPLRIKWRESCHYSSSIISLIFFEFVCNDKL